MNNTICTVTGATSNVGKVVVAKLRAQGCEVREVSRAAGVSFDDKFKLEQAFDGANCAYLVVPFDMTVPDLHKRRAKSE